MEHQLLLSDGWIITRGHGALQKKKKGPRPHLVMQLHLQSPSKPTLFVSVQNFTSFLVLETARNVVFASQTGQNNCAAAHARSLEETLLATCDVQKKGVPMHVLP